MGYKSRAGWGVDICIGNCENRNLKCQECVGRSQYRPGQQDQDLQPVHSGHLKSCILVDEEQE